MPFGIGHPPYTSNAVYMCVGGVQGSQIFKWNSIILIHSKVMAFLVILLSPWSQWSPHRPRHPHVIPTLSLSSPGHPHSPQKVTMWSPWLWSPPHVVPVVPMVPMSSPSSPCRPHCPHIIHTLSRRSPHHLQPPSTHLIHRGVGDPESVKMQ